MYVYVCIHLLHIDYCWITSCVGICYSQVFCRMRLFVVFSSTWLSVTSYWRLQNNLALIHLNGFFLFLLVIPLIQIVWILAQSWFTDVECRYLCSHHDFSKSTVTWKLLLSADQFVQAKLLIVFVFSVLLHDRKGIWPTKSARSLFLGANLTWDNPRK